MGGFLFEQRDYLVLFLETKKWDGNNWGGIYFLLPCFVSVVLDSMFQRHRFNYEYINLYKQVIAGKSVVIEAFAVCKCTLVVCFDHLSEVMFHDRLVCSHYNRRTFYRLLIENERFPSHIRTITKYRIFLLMNYFRSVNVMNNTTAINIFNSDNSNIVKSWQPLHIESWNLNPRSKNQ